MFGNKKRIEELENVIDGLERSLQLSRAETAQAQQQIADMQNFITAHGGEEVWKQDQVLLEAQRRATQAQIEAQQQEAAVNDRAEAAQQQMEQKKERLEEQIKTLELVEREIEQRLQPKRDKLKLVEAGLDDFTHPASDSIALGTELRELRKKISEETRSQKAVKSNRATELPTTKAGREKLARDFAQLAIRSFNAEAENIIKAATAKNYETSVNKLIRAAEAVERYGKSSGVRITPSYLELRARELNIAVEYLKKKALEKEIEREHKAELREQAKAERELEAERERLEKEKQHYLNVIKAVEATGNEEEIHKLQDELVEIEKGLNSIEERAANIRAGYVYVISNIGSFGERMVKIGMTRRLVPMDRIKELSDASVPFNFDVHALFFSPDAVGIETELHHRFASKRVNRVNARREFFYVTPAEVRDALTDVAGNLLEFIEEPDAEQYKISLELASEEQPPDDTGTTPGGATING